MLQHLHKTIAGLEHSVEEYLPARMQTMNQTGLPKHATATVVLSMRVSAIAVIIFAIVSFHRGIWQVLQRPLELIITDASSGKDDAAADFFFFC